MKTYGMTKAAEKFEGKKGSHSVVVIQALKALGSKATGEAVAEYVEKKKLLTGSKMEPRKAVSWALANLVRLKVLKAEVS